jgi:predicted DNA-binding transcriptional regulator AlpA
MTAIDVECEQVVEPVRQSEFLFAEEFCLRLGCSESSLGRWIRRGLVPAPVRSYPGVRLAWHRSDVEAYLAALA